MPRFEGYLLFKLSKAFAMNTKNIIAILVFRLTLELVFSSGAIAAIPAVQRSVLIALYNSADCYNWDNNNGWKTSPLTP